MSDACDLLDRLGVLEWKPSDAVKRFVERLSNPMICPECGRGLNLTPDIPENGLNPCEYPMDAHHGTGELCGDWWCCHGAKFGKIDWYTNAEVTT